MWEHPQLRTYNGFSTGADPGDPEEPANIPLSAGL